MKEGFPGEVLWGSGGWKRMAQRTRGWEECFGKRKAFVWRATSEKQPRRAGSSKLTSTVVVILTLNRVQLFANLWTDCSTPGFPVLHHLPEFAQTHVHWISDAIQPTHPLSPPSPSAFSLSQHQDLFQWVVSLHQVAKVLELQLQHQFFQWIFRVDFL